MQNIFSCRSALARLVLFAIALSLAGCIVAGIQYAAVDLPARENLRTVASDYARCTGGCVHTNVVYTTPGGVQNPADEACLQKCRDEYLGK